MTDDGRSRPDDKWIRQFETVYFVTRPDYRSYADAQQSINLRILEAFRAMEVSFIATAPQPIQLHRLPGPAADASGQQRIAAPSTAGMGWADR